MKRIFLVAGLTFAIFLIFFIGLKPYLIASYNQIRNVRTLELIRNADDNVAAQLLENHYIDPNMTNPKGESLLLWAVSRNSRKTVGKLLESGADPNMSNADGVTPLMMAVSVHNLDIVKNLIQANARLGALDHSGRNALFYAVRHSDSALLSFLIDEGLDVNDEDSSRSTPLHSAIKWNSIDVVTVLLAHGADLMALDQQGRSPLTLMEDSPYYNNYLQLDEVKKHLPANYFATMPVEDHSEQKEPHWDFQEMQHIIHRKVNLKRKEHGLPPYEYNKTLERLALSHSRDMAEKKYFAHINQEGENPTQRAVRMGVQVEIRRGGKIQVGIAENLFMCSKMKTMSYYLEGGVRKESRKWHDVNSITDMIVDGWMNSPGHRKNMLSKTLSSEGLGLSISEEKQIYASQEMR